MPGLQDIHYSHLLCGDEGVYILYIKNTVWKPMSREHLNWDITTLIPLECIPKDVTIDWHRDATRASTVNAFRNCWRRSRFLD